MAFRSPIKIVVAAGLTMAALVFLCLPVAGQFYGRNKVQYNRFDFKIMKTRHFDIYFYMEDQDTIKQAGVMAERWYARLSRMFNHELKGRQPLILYSSGPQFQQTTVIAGTMGEGTGGVTESAKRRIILPYGPSLSETDHVIGHELVHAFQYDIMARGHADEQRGGSDVANRIPLWFIEGMAEYLSIGPVDPNTAMWMRDTVRRKDLPQISKLENSYKYFPYRYGHALWSYITGMLGDEVIGKMMKTAGRSGAYDFVLEATLGAKVKKISADWHKAMQDAYIPLYDKTQMPDKVGKTLVKASENAIYNVSPAVSPDGKQMLFLSSRELFSIDLYLADAVTGKIIRKVISTAIDPHFESLQFIRSAGSWDAKGERFVFGAIAKGRPQLTVVNVPKNKIEREIPFPELGEILNPAWSPDGRNIVFSALAGGVSDLFIYDLQTSTVKQMTRDAFGDLEPVWSPDGRQIAFVTERFSTNLAWMDIGNYELGLMDPETGQVQKLLGFPSGKNINPQWSPDSKSIYFLSDQSGKTDIYRIDLQTNKIFEVTNLYAGVSGITELSPAISVAQNSGRLIYSGYDEGRYSIYAIDSPEVLVGQSFLSQFGDVSLGLLPPRKQPEGSLLGLLKNPLYGLPKDTNFMVSGYKPKLTLDYLAPPSVGIGVDRYGTYGAGGIAAYWSDMLGTHTLMTMAQTGYYLQDTDAAIAYQNTQHRLNWGGILQRFSYPYPFYSVYYDTVLGEPAYVEEENIYRQISYDASLFGSYPLSQVQRIEIYGGYKLLDFDWTVYKRAYSLTDGSLLINEKQKRPTPKSISYAYLSAALVYDTGIFGATSPILGESYLLQVSPSLGNLSMYTVMADYRRYFMPIRPFTLAFRAIHYGRYGRDAEDSRLWPLYIGYWDLVRGYESFNYSNQNQLNEFDPNRLYGSKILIGNVELRFPLLRVLGIGKGFYGPFPIEAYAFYDWGLAWDGVDKAYFMAGGTRRPVTSAGIGLRTNIFGYLVLGFNYVYPFERPSKGWHFQLSISPGF
jgi:Tol biopolymer transport system component